MKCEKCGADLKEGCLYCSVCGNEVQIVPDYSVLEDDYLRALLKEETQDKKTVGSGDGGEKKRDRQDTLKKKKNNKMPIIVVCCILAVLIIVGVVVKVTIDHRNANSYDYQVSMAEKESVDKNYENALHYYKTALSLKPDDIVVRMAMADIYMEQRDYDSAMVVLMEVIKLDGAHIEAYKDLIHIYDENEDYSSILELSSGITNSEILELFEPYMVTEPVISPIGGEYEEYIDVMLYSIDGYDIYYTLDGTEPDMENGILYHDDEEIPLDEAGKYEIHAVCVNEKGICSDMITASYELDIQPPEYATVIPDGGRIEDITFVMIEAEEGCSIYYTWDGTDPTEASTRYETPLEIPTGNNVLSVLVVDDKTGLDSGVYRTNFIYYP